MTSEHTHEPEKPEPQEHLGPSFGLREATLEGVHFDDVALLACRFRNVDLSCVEFDDAGMVEARLHNVDLARSQFDDADLSGASLHNINLQSCTLDDVDLTMARLHDVSMRDSVLDDVDMGGVCITNALIDGLCIDGIEIAPLVEAARASRDAQAGAPAASPGA